MRLILLMLVLLCAGPTLPILHAQNRPVQRCVKLTGETAYTDKNCEDIGAINRLPRTDASSGATGSSRLYRSGCARTLSELAYEITAAIDAKDVNRLASVYHWVGVSDASANKIFTQLEGIVGRPLVDLVPLRPAPPPIVDDAGVVVDSNEDGFYPQTSKPPRPYALRLEQTQKNGSTPSRTVFQLQRNFNCFWVTL